MYGQLSSIGEVEIKSEKYLGHNHLKTLHETVPNINADKLVDAIHEANKLIDHLLDKYSVERLEKGSEFIRKVHMLIQLKDIKRDVEVLACCQEELESLRKRAEADLSTFIHPLTELKSAYEDEDYIKNILPEQDEYNRLLPKIMGVIQIADLKKQSIENAIQNSKNVEVELTGFADTTMFQIKEYMSRFEDKHILEENVVLQLQSNMQRTQRVQNLSTILLHVGSIVTAMALFLGVLGFPVPVKSLSNAASLTFTFYFFSLSFVLATLVTLVKEWFVKATTTGYDETYIPLLMAILFGSLTCMGVFSFVIRRFETQYAIYQLIPSAAIPTLICSISLTVVALFFRRECKQRYTYLKDAEHKITA